ncbi:MAG: hypothetical protein ACKPKO_47535, partial [Candidatus Fonsibacter sp.]
PGNGVVTAYWAGCFSCPDLLALLVLWISDASAMAAAPLVGTAGCLPCPPGLSRTRTARRRAQRKAQCRKLLECAHEFDARKKADLCSEYQMTDVIQPVLALWRSPPMVHTVGLPMLTDGAVAVPSADTHGRIPEAPYVQRTRHDEHETGSEGDSLSGDVGTDTSDQEDLGSDSDHDVETRVATQPTTRLLYAEYREIGRLLIGQLVRGEEQGVQIRESDLIE